MYPSAEEWERIFSRAETYIHEYLSNPDIWIQRYFQNGKQLFYDEETPKKMKREGEHLIDTWVVSLNFDGRFLKWKIFAEKEVDGWNLEELLWGGTDDYTSENEMVYWYRFSEGWKAGKKRKGIRPQIVNSFHMFQNDAIDYGLKKAIQEWEDDIDSND